MAVELPNGYITTSGGNRYINSFGAGASFFAGLVAGNTAAFNQGSYNTGIGNLALPFILSGQRNTAVGCQTLAGLTTAYDNTAIGMWALSTSNAEGNTAIGSGALKLVTDGKDNVAVGFNAGSALVHGSNNIYIGYAETGLELESLTIRIGANATLSAENCYIGGINGKSLVGSSQVLIDENNKLGTTVSARRYKENINPLDSQDRFMALKPVTFSYKSDEAHHPQFGLIAEEVETVYPELALYNKAGQIESVAYHQLYAILIKEIQQNRTCIAELQGRIAMLEALVVP